MTNESTFQKHRKSTQAGTKTKVMITVKIFDAIKYVKLFICSFKLN